MVKSGEVLSKTYPVSIDFVSTSNIVATVDELLTVEKLNWEKC